VTPSTIRFPVLVALAVLTGCAKQRRPERPQVPVTTATVQRRSVPYELSAIGAVTPIQSVALRSQVNGILVRVGFREGDDVNAGRVLFEIDRRPYEAALHQALGALAKDAAQLDNARRQVARYEELARTQTVTREQFDQLVANAEALAASVSADSAAVENARLNLDFCTIRAPIAGRTGNVLIREGNLVRAGEAAPLVVINQIRPIAVSFSVPQRYLDDIRRFSTNRRLDVVIRPSGDSSAALTGALTFINNQMDTTTATIQLKATFANSDRRLWPGEFVTVRLILDVRPDVLTIPSQAVVAGQSGSFVYVVNPDRTTSTRSIEVGPAVDDDDVVVLAGLEAGQEVVTDGQLRLVPGARVDVKRPVEATGDPGLGDSAAAPAGAGGTPAAGRQGRRGATP
jgi:multidrug efflux system membrane fusion protein